MQGRNTAESPIQEVFLQSNSQSEVDLWFLMAQRESFRIVRAQGFMEH